ncbi:MAG: hypothetical protein COA73_14280 [Candidatus Hydrogenedentota bacterium]|nr:MAG: hypothetical protein COA73_14280 [Candidatus Hydrogenedentota bacterium]
MVDDGKWTWAIVESAVDGIVTIDNCGVIEYINPAAQTMFGYTSEELIGQNVDTLMPSPYKENHDGYLESYLKTGVRKIIGKGREVVARRKDGSTFPVKLAVSEVKLGDKIIFTGVIHDISEQKEAQAEKDRLLQELNWRNKELNCLFRVGEIIRAGKVGGGEFGEVSHLLHSTIADADVSGTRIAVDDREYTSDPFQATPWKLHADIVAENRVRGHIEVFFVGEQTEEALRVVQKDKLNMIRAVASIFGEAIGRLEAEAKVMQASKLASIGELAAGVGHEINNPINGIINCADILIKESADGTKSKQFSELIRSEADRIANIVRDLLTFSRQDKKEYSAARLTDIVDGVLTLSRKGLEKSFIHLETDVPEDLPKLECRSEQVQQVVMNLIINAMHALDERYSSHDENKILRITARAFSEAEYPFIKLIIRDHGTGILPAHQDRVFDPFFTTKGRDQGTGLGLSVSDGIIKGHNGSITVNSNIGEFTEFIVELPLKNRYGGELRHHPERTS